MVSKSKRKNELDSLARSHAPNAIKVLAGIMTNRQTAPAARVAAAAQILDRGYGKAVSSVEMTGKDGEPLAVADMSKAEQLRRFPHAFSVLSASLGKGDLAQITGDSPPIDDTSGDA